MTKIVCIVLPTYNEAENIRGIIKAIFDQKNKIPGKELHVLVVDDKSPDGTGGMVKELMRTNKNLHLLEGDKQGLGAAYIRGFRHALDRLKPEIIIEMDADFSHPPRLLPKLVAGIDRGSDFVIASRYVPGGATPEWPFLRKLNSKTANFVAKTIAGVEVNDSTSGYRAIRASLLRKIDLSTIQSKGYSFQIGILAAAIEQGAKTAEIPLVFKDRERGKSKMRLFDIMEFFLIAGRLRLRKWRHFIRFCIVGTSGIVVNTAILYALSSLAGMDYKLASVLAIEAAVITNFLLNDAWTFESAGKKGKFSRFLSFNVISIVGALINWGVLVGLTELAGVYYLVANLIGILVGFLWNYFANVRFTWKTKK
jgi:dolichol-phosphate mannosyltransferase